MAVNFLTKTDSGSTLSGDDPLVLTKPSGTIDGDLLIAVIGLMGNESTIDSVPSGWTLIEQKTGNSGEETIYTYYKVAASEGASWDWGRTAADAQALWAVLRLEGQADSGIINADNSASVTNDPTASYANGITPTTANSMLVFAIAATDQDGSGASSYAVATDNPTWTERITLTATSGGSGVTLNAGLYVATAPRPETTDTGNSSATLAGGGTTVDSTAILFAITPRPPQAAAPDAEVVSFTISAVTPTVVIPAAPTPELATMTLSVPDVAAEVVTPDWTNAEKSTAPSWTNPDKS